MIDGVSDDYINVLRNEVLSIIELLYYSNSPSKKILYDMGIY